MTAYFKYRNEKTTNSENELIVGSVHAVHKYSRPGAGKVMQRMNNMGWGTYWDDGDGDHQWPTAGSAYIAAHLMVTEHTCWVRP